MERLKVRRQGNTIMLTIPKSFNIPEGTRLTPRLTHNGIFYEFVDDDFLDFDTNILSELVSAEYEEELVAKFKEYKQTIPKAMEQLKGKSKVFKAGNSYGSRLTASDKRTLNINAGDDMVKTISPDHISITFTKKGDVDPDILKTIDSLYDENKDLMEFLKDK